MYSNTLVDVPAFICERISQRACHDEWRMQRSRLAQGLESGRQYLLRRGLFEAIAERLYYQWAVSRGIAVRPVQFLKDKRGYKATRGVRHLSAVWWTGVESESEEVDTVEQASGQDIPRALALDLLLDNVCRFTGWMYDGNRAYKLFNHQTLGLGSGPIPMLTRMRLMHQGGISPKIDVEGCIEGLNDEEKTLFFAEAQGLAKIEDDEVRRLCALPVEVGEEALKVCHLSLGTGAGSREARKIMMTLGPEFMESYSFEYIVCRRRELSHRLRHIQRA